MCVWCLRLWGFFLRFLCGVVIFFAFHNSLFLYFCAHVQGSCFLCLYLFCVYVMEVHVVSIKFADTHPRLFLGISSHTWAISKPDTPVEENHRPRTTYREKADDRHGILLSSSGSFFRLARWMDGSSAY